jgi:catechol 2,3-dioxygenase-like lactoylglutathione lyase family enzyme
MFQGAGATLPASDVGRAKAFYRDKLGFEPTQETPDGSARYDVDGHVFSVYPSAFAGTNQATAMMFLVDDAAAAVGELRNRGVEFQDIEYGEMRTVDGILTMPDGAKGAWFADSEGNIIGLFQEPSS